jgi:hypothetical protein
MLSRRPRNDRHLEAKVRVFTLAAVAALAGMYWDAPIGTGLAIALLVVAMFLGFLPGGTRRRTALEDASEEDDITT